ncbi:hypothetical protein [Ruegeria faecimaris]|uniref:hypothetical protein n=2 Tax=Ruegeria TaxID=97050 RepID=UPI00232FFF7C|nr:hypothetical protein [Ruegeria faecimaris]
MHVVGHDVEFHKQREARIEEVEPASVRVRQSRRKLTMSKFVGASFLGSFTALGVATCCILPMALILLGLGGSWLAVFGKIAAASYYVLGGSTALLFLSGIVAYRRGSLDRLKWWLTGSFALTAIAWVIVLNEIRINDFLITLM